MALRLARNQQAARAENRRRLVRPWVAGTAILLRAGRPSRPCPRGSRSMGSGITLAARSHRRRRSRGNRGRRLKFRQCSDVGWHKRSAMMRPLCRALPPPWRHCCGLLRPSRSSGAGVRTRAVLQLHENHDDARTPHPGWRGSASRGDGGTYRAHSVYRPIFIAGIARPAFVPVFRATRLSRRHRSHPSWRSRSSRRNALPRSFEVVPRVRRLPR